MRLCTHLIVCSWTTTKLHASKGVQTTINIGDVVKYKCPVTCRRRTATAEAVDPAKDCPLVLSTRDVLCKDHHVYSGIKSKHRSFNIRQYELKKEGDYKEIGSLFAKAGIVFTSNLKAGVNKFWEEVGEETLFKKIAPQNKISLSPTIENNIDFI